MTTIPQTFQKNGWHYVLRDRKGSFDLYSQSSRPNMPDTRKASAYEVVVIRVRKTVTVNFPGRTVVYPEAEYLPSNEDWGSFGWTFHTREAAEKKLAQLAAKASS